MDHKNKALQLRQQGYNCAQSVACAYADDLPVNENLLFSLVEGYGAGMADTYGTCGALSGATAIISLLYSDGDLNNPQSKAATYKLVKILQSNFRQKNHSTICRTLKGIDSHEVLRSCPGCIEDAVEILDEILSNKNK